MSNNLISGFNQTPEQIEGIQVLCAYLNIIEML